MEDNEQANFWKKTYADEYLRKNDGFDHNLLLEGWKTILKKLHPVGSILECGANIGRNIGALEILYPNAKMMAIEVSPAPIKVFRERFPHINIEESLIADSNLSDLSHDLVFTIGVLIHVHPDHLGETLERMFNLSSRYIVIGEYFNRTPVMVEYQGAKDKLFKRDFGKLVLETFRDRLTLVDYGFLWGHIYDAAGFDDITYWVFEKTDHLDLKGL